MKMKLKWQKTRLIGEAKKGEQIALKKFTAYNLVQNIDYNTGTVPPGTSQNCRQNCSFVREIPRAIPPREKMTDCFLPGLFPLL